MFEDLVVFGCAIISRRLRGGDIFEDPVVFGCAMMSRGSRGDFRGSYKFWIWHNVLGSEGVDFRGSYNVWMRRDV